MPAQDIPASRIQPAVGFLFTRGWRHGIVVSMVASLIPTAPAAAQVSR
jgi:hypothetical protein